MQKLSKQPLRQCTETARQAVSSSLYKKTPLLFVYDVIRCLNDLKFVLDAGRPPLVDGEDFEHVYGLPQKLAFKRAEPRLGIKSDWWSAFY